MTLIRFVDESIGDECLWVRAMMVVLIMLLMIIMMMLLLTLML